MSEITSRKSCTRRKEIGGEKTYSSDFGVVVKTATLPRERGGGKEGGLERER